MRGEQQSTRLSKLRGGLHRWTKRSSKAQVQSHGVGRPGGGYSCSRETSQVGRQRDSVANLELSYEGLRGSHRPAAVGGHDRCRDQYGRVEPRNYDASHAVKECGIVCRPGHVLHWQSLGSHRHCSAWLEHGGVVDALSSVFPE